MANSRTTICNDALGHLGQPRLVIDTDADHQEHTHAEHVMRNYDLALAAVLEDHEWTFAKRRTMIEPAGTAPAFGWTWAYPLPDGCARIWRVNPDAEGRTAPYEIVGNQIHTDESAPLPVEWIERITDPALFSGQFNLALGLKIASLSCLKVLNSTGEQEGLERAYERCKIDAKGTSSQQRPQPQAFTGTWLIGRGVS